MRRSTDESYVYQGDVEDRNTDELAALLPDPKREQSEGPDGERLAPVMISVLPYRVDTTTTDACCLDGT